jgi:hypothetical protein
MRPIVLTNATLLRIDMPGVATTAGDVPYTTGAALAVRCALDEPTSSQRYVLASAIAEATAVVYVPMADVPEGALVRGCRVVVRLDTFADSTTLRLVYVKARRKGSLGVYEAFGRTA